MEKKNRRLPRAALEHLMLAAERTSQRVKDKTSVEIFKNYLRLMDKYSDYFFSEPWPKKYDYKRATIFNRVDLDFIDENDDEYVDRVLTVLLKKNLSLKGFNADLGMFWTGSAYNEKFIMPELKTVFGAFKELAKTGTSAEEILTRLKEKFEDISFIHLSFNELFEVEGSDKSLDLRVSEILELIHTVEG